MTENVDLFPEMVDSFPEKVDRLDSVLSEVA